MTNNNENNEKERNSRKNGNNQLPGEPNKPPATTPAVQPQPTQGEVFPPYPTRLPVQVQQYMQLWQSPYPPPEAVERFEEVLPGSFNRILVMAEKQQEAQIELSRKAIDYAHADIKRAHWLAISLGAIACLCALAALQMGYPVVGGFFLGVPLLGVAKAIIDSTMKPQAPTTEALERPAAPPAGTTPTRREPSEDGE